MILQKMQSLISSTLSFMNFAFVPFNFQDCAFYGILSHFANMNKERRTGSAWNPVPEGETNYCSLTFSAGLPLINTSFSIHSNYK
ncbi:hypothetical protein JCM21738_2940 [Mesobacillus boroniphilus JCM 21738]|uniref:Uncharacterized protein n=1 Tax=Mesobacillus boroniphilus JCM 21738 TaxID=1294265 RepID=W4RR49_9BACI|nr:hypothetical protein JCM21738_2940 [Mesobacillus boroniphilus JCM 21738]